MSNTKYLTMIKELGWTSETICNELGCTPEEVARSMDNVGALPFHSTCILCDKYNAIMSPSTPVTIDLLIDA